MNWTTKLFKRSETEQLLSLRGWGRGDVIIVVAGLGLAGGCALFPWYVFFNQEKFGIQAMKFAGNNGSNTMPSVIANQPELVRRAINPGDVPFLTLDLLSTGTLPAKGDLSSRETPLAEQPFPGEEKAAAFSLVHVANGRAMIEDADGLWVVQKGSVLPDESRVAAIEQRNGTWVIVTDKNRVIAMGR